MSLAFALEKEVAIAAVLRACKATTSVFKNLVEGEKLTKDDKSPVTVGDFAAQAVVNSILGKAFPDDKVVGEEDASDLRDETKSTLRSRVVALANDTLSAELGLGEYAHWGLGPGSQRSTEDILAAIDRGNYEGGSTGRMWALDPIDGTKGFLRGEQYAVCLAFLVDAQVQVGVIGCPNLPRRLKDPESPIGSLFVAVRGQGVEQRTLLNSQPEIFTMPTLSDADLNFLESVESSHSSHGFNDRVAQVLNITREPTRMDSQAKYCALARGDGGAYLRMPTNPDYREKIWDHAAGSLIVEEAGGVVSDSDGNPLDFGAGRTLKENNGIVGASKAIHGRVIEAIQQVKNASKSPL